MNFINSLMPTFQHLGSFGYWLIFLITFTESLAFIGSIIPGSLLVALAGFLSVQGFFEFGDLIWFVAGGAILGDSLSYWLGTKETKYFKHENRWLKQAHLERGEKFFKKHGGKSIFLSRFIGPIRAIIPFTAGLSKMNIWRFLTWEIISVTVWAVFFLLIGFFCGGAFSLVKTWSTRAGLFILLIIILIILIKILIKYFPPLFSFFKSIGISIKNGILSNPDIKKISHTHPKFIAFLKKRLTTKKFSGLPLTLLLIAFIYILLIYLGTIESIIKSEPLVTADIQTANLLYTFRDVELIRVFMWFTLLGKIQIVLCFAIIATILLWVWHKRYFILPLWLTIAGSTLFSWLVKLIIHRPRPDLAYYSEAGYSFPSGHATLAIAFYGFIAYILLRQKKNWKLKINILFFSILIILGIGLSRLYLGVHYLSDVWGGFLLGALWLIIGISFSEWLKIREIPESTRVGKNAKIITVILLFAGFFYYIYFGLHYYPIPNAIKKIPNIIIANNIQNIFNENRLPKYTETLTGGNQEPLSFIIITNDDQTLIDDMGIAGWQLADKIDPSNIINMVRHAILNDNYPTAPMTPSFWNNQVHDFGFEKPTESESVRQRHHARFWTTGIKTTEGKNIYIGTDSQDTGLKWLVAHKISPDIDTERELLFSDLQKTGNIIDYQKIQSVQPVLGQNSIGDQFFTDGKTYVINLK